MRMLIALSFISTTIISELTPMIFKHHGMMALESLTIEAGAMQEGGISLNLD